jgi:hemoglobin-like flavoprotein
LRAALASSDKDEALGAIARLMGAQAALRGIKREDYVTCVDALFWTLERSLRDDFTPEMRQAWGLFALEMARLMIGETGAKPARGSRKRRA